jgi:hypothetical protein
MDVVSRLTAAVPPGGRSRTSNPGWPRGPLPVGASRRDLPPGCARRRSSRSLKDRGSNPLTSTRTIVVQGSVGAAPGGSGAAPFAFGHYSLGHLSVSAALVELDEAELDVVAEDEALVDGLASAAWAIADPPPTRAPEIANVIAIRLIRCRIFLTSSVSSSISQAKRAEEPRGVHGGSPERTRARPDAARGPSRRCPLPRASCRPGSG